MIHDNIKNNFLKYYFNIFLNKKYFFKKTVTVILKKLNLSCNLSQGKTNVAAFEVSKAFL
jgi:hypothetical protein